MLLLFTNMCISCSYVADAGHITTCSLDETLVQWFVFLVLWHFRIITLTLCTAQLLKLFRHVTLFLLRHPFFCMALAFYHSNYQDPVFHRYDIIVKSVKQSNVGKFYYVDDTSTNLRKKNKKANNTKISQDGEHCKFFFISKRSVRKVNKVAEEFGSIS